MQKGGREGGNGVKRVEGERERGRERGREGGREREKEGKGE